MKTILVPLDFSETGFRQLQAVRAFLPPKGGRVDLVHVHPSKLDVTEEEHRQLDLHLRNLDALLEGREVETRARFLDGAVATAILKEARRLESDLIIVGSHGHGAAYDALFGSVARRLIANSPLPLVIVPEGSERPAESVHRFVVAVDFGPRTEELVTRVADLAASSGAQFKLLHVVPEPMEVLGIPTASSTDSTIPQYADTAREKAAIRLGELVQGVDLPVNVQCEVQYGAVPNQLIDVAKSGLDVLVLGSHGHGRAYDLLLGSIAQEVVKKSVGLTLLFPLHAKVESSS